ncbi:hypothetical protein JOB18_027041 [Solea senegalensis]|nr:hypothetical protein JOB18_027041 [Solea senegalensis]
MVGTIAPPITMVTNINTIASTIAHPVTIIMETVVMDATSAQLATTDSTVITMETTVDLLVTITIVTNMAMLFTMEKNKVPLFITPMETKVHPIIVKVTPLHHITIFMVQVTTTKAATQKLSVLLHQITTGIIAHPVTMVIITAHHITITITTSISITQETTTVKLIIITMVIVNLISITMETTTMNLLSITMETITVQAITINMETTTGKCISITMGTTTGKHQSISMETNTGKHMSITMETTTGEHHHGDHHRETHEHHHGDHCSSGHQHHHGDHHTQSHWYFHEVEHNRSHLHHHDNHHGDSHLHHHSDHSKESHPHLHDNHRSDSHHHSHHSKESHPQLHGDHHNESYLHHHGNHNNKSHPHHHGNYPSESHPHHHRDNNSESHLHHHEDEVCHHQGHHPESHVNHDDLHTHLKGPSARSPPSHRKSESHTNKADLPSNPRNRDEEQTSFLDSSSSYKEKPDELGRITKSQDKDDGLHQSSLRTAVRTECSGEEFMNNQRLLEAELQKTRMELSNLTERFKRLHDSCSSTEQTNDLLQKNIHSMAQSMEGERERLNRRISALTEQLADAKFTDNVETGTHFNATSALHNTNIHFQSDGAINQVVLPITPPPTQFMDIAKASGQEQSLGSVPEEEEESDWSEMGEEIPRFILTGLGRNQVWRHQEGDMDGDSESGGEEMFRLHSSARTPQIPHLQFTIHSEILPALQTNTCPPGFTNLSEAMTVESSYRITSSPALCSSILIRSASLEELPHRHVLKELRGTEAMMDLHHHPSHEVMEDLDDEIIHHWRTSSDMGAGIGSAMESGLVGLRSAEQMLNHFICESQLSEGKVQSGAAAHGWTGGIRDEVLKGERTEL